MKSSPSLKAALIPIMLATAKLLGPVLSRALDELSQLSPEALLQQRYDKFRHMGQFFS